MCLCLMRNFSPPTDPSFIFFYLHPLFSPNSPSTLDEPGQLKIYLPKKLLECLPKCSSLPKERHRWNTNEVRMWHTREGNICDSEMNCLLVTHLWQMSHWEMKRRPKKPQWRIFIIAALWHQLKNQHQPKNKNSWKLDIYMQFSALLSSLFCNPNNSAFRHWN